MELVGSTDMARVLAKIVARGADGSAIEHGSLVALESDPDVTFDVVGWAVAQGTQLAIIERFGKTGMDVADTLMVVEASRLVRMDAPVLLKVDEEARAEAAIKAQKEALRLGIVPKAEFEKDGRRYVVEAIGGSADEARAFMLGEDGIVAVAKFSDFRPGGFEAVG